MITLDFAENGVVSIRRETEEDGVHREARAPGAYLSDLPPYIRAEIEAAWTPAVIAAFLAAHPPEPEPTVDLAAYAADKRWRLQEGGIVINGVAIRTDKDSRDMIGDACDLAEKQPAETIMFKAMNGWVELDAATMGAIGLAVGAYVRELFRAESQVVAAIASGEITSTAEIDAALLAVATG